MKVSKTKSIQHSSFRLNPIAASIALAMAAQFASNAAQANGGGYGSNTNISGATIDVQTYYANSPQGKRPAYDFVTHTLSTTGATLDTGTPLRKFVDPLHGASNGLDGNGIPVAITEKWFNPITNKQTSDDYYEIGVVEYAEQMHSDLPKATTLRGYVQIETPAILAGLKDAAGVASEHIPATYPDGSPIYRWEKDPVTGKMVETNVQVYWVHKPHSLGPVIVANSGTAVRVKYTNYLPYRDAAGVAHGSPNGGDLLIPVDPSIVGSEAKVDANGKPMMGANGAPLTFSQNRVSIHWHGGDTPWVSDGTPHQWIAPAGEASAWANGVGQGVSFQNVPDMPDPGFGSGTLYFPNNLSGRLMFYHDHTFGLTRLNVYAGVAAGYVVTDPVERKLVGDAIGTSNLLDIIGTPLVIQDKTFVPNNIGPIGGSVTVKGVTSTVTQSQDAKWDLNHWGQPGDLWFPHVYETNQDPNSIDGTNPVGRWDWGPWFWPVFPSQFSLPTGAYGDVTVTPEAFMDTPTINGQAYPTMNVDPKTYRFRILNAANDRTQNLGFYVAVDSTGALCDAANTAPAQVAPMTGEAALASCTEVKMVPATPTASFPAGWPTDGRPDGVPDPATAGPDIVQIGSEGGLLPKPVVLKSQPINYDYNKRSITILNVKERDLLLGGAERADVLVDFSKYAGKTLILYNDAPTPMPALDPRTDYTSNNGDKTDAGGAYNTLPGYGPNIRTIMQIKVANITPAAPLNVAALATAMPAAYAATQPVPNVPEAIYNAPFGTNDTNNYAGISVGSGANPAFVIPKPGFVDIGTVVPKTGLLTLNGAVTVTNGGAGYSAATTAQVVGGGGTGALATPTIVGGVITAVTITNGGTGYTSAPTIQFTDPAAAPAVAGSGAIVTVNVLPAATRLPVINKAIQELFDPTYGRMNATLAVELPFSTALVATTIPLAYVDAPAENMDSIKDGETQIWKITHNGVDSHPVHFHLMNVQVLNRVDWTGVIKGPNPGEEGWKETLLMNPLEDVYVAAKGYRPAVPFGLPASARPLDPSQAIGGTLGFSQVDQLTGAAPVYQTQLVNGVTTNVPLNGAPYSNQMTSFDNEYVWHCHILGHEENDFMRPFVFHPNVIVPDMPGAPVVAGTTLTWTDPTPVGGVDAYGVPTATPSATKLNAAGTASYLVEATNNPKNEIGFKVKVGGVVVATVPANATSWTDPTGLVNLAGASVVAYNAAGESVGTTPTVASAATAAPNAPTAPAPSTVAGPTGLTQTNVAGNTLLSWDAVAGATGYLVTAGGITQTVTSTTATITGIANGMVTVVAVTPTGNSAAASAYNGKAYTPVALTVVNAVTPKETPASMILTWANNPLNVNNVTGLTLTWRTQGGPLSTVTFPATATGATIINLRNDVPYTFNLIANSSLGSSLAVTANKLSAP